MDFKHKIFNINRDAEIDKTNFAYSNVSICDSDGDLVLYSNGNNIFNKYHEIIENGKNLYENEGCEGIFTPQGLLILPVDDLESRFILISTKANFFESVGDVGCKEHFYHIVDLTLNGGKGKVTTRNELFFDEITTTGSLMACKHANGNDWWVLRFIHSSNKYNKFLVQSDTIINMGNDTLEHQPISGIGQMHFSPDGSKLGMINLNGQQIGRSIDVFDFDRCTGLLSNQKHIFEKRLIRSAGVSFSPDSKLFYVAFDDELWQFDMEADNFENSKQVVGIYDGFIEIYEGFELPTNFWLMQAGLDGKLYITTSYSGHYFHVIHDPNKRGIDCNFEQRGIEWPVMKGLTIPNFPNYRLGPIDGSSCDTLGIDNFPVAKYRYSRGEGLLVSFTDLSYYEPTSWLWDFGNNQIASGQNPGHIYQQEGGYEICLTVSNENGSDEYCEDICVKSGAPFLAEIPPTAEVLDCDNIPYDLEMFVLDIDSLGGESSFSTIWSGPDNFQSTERVTKVEHAGTYYVTITLDDLDCVFKDSVTFERDYLVGNPTFEQVDNVVTFFGNDSTSNHFWDFGNGKTSEEEVRVNVYEETGVYTVTHTVSNDCESITSYLEIEVTVLSSEVARSDVFLIYPNPASEEIWIKGAEKGDIFQLYNAAGMKVLEERIDASSAVVSINFLSAGIYFYIIGEEREVGKLVVL